GHAAQRSEDRRRGGPGAVEGDLTKLTPIELAAPADQDAEFFQRREHPAHGGTAHAEDLAKPALEEAGVRSGSAPESPPAPFGALQQNEEPVESGGGQAHRGGHRSRGAKR